MVRSGPNTASAPLAETELLPGDESPLDAAVSARDGDILALVAHALDTRNVRLAFQPVTPAAQPNCPMFWEGLTRILDPAGRVIPARDFINVAERHEIGRRIDCAALELGIAALRATPDLRLSLNMSARSIGYRRWIRTLQHGLSLDPTIGERLILEVTEASAMLMPDIVAAFMQDRRREGIAFALDDFGAGYTSFRYLREFFFDIVKIDGQFIRGIGGNADNQVLTSALVSISRHFDMFTVAESVESGADAALLAEMGVDCIQGYHVGAPTLSPPWLDASQRLTA